MSILYNRIRFTEMVDECLASGDLAPAIQSVQTKREHLIKQMRQPHEDAYRRQLKNLLTLFQEFHDVLKDIGTDMKAKWNKEMKFYPANDGTITCKVEDLEIMCSDNYGTSDMLVTTKLTRECRPNIINCMVNKKIYLAEGPAGTGKTETCKDVLRMIGMEPIAVNCNEDLPSSEALLKMWRETAEKVGGKKCAIIFDEFNRCSNEVCVQILKAFLNEGVFVCATYNLGYAGRTKFDWLDSLPNFGQSFKLPPIEDIARCMLANEGILECDEIGPCFVKFIDGCKAKMSKQHHYDFGLRNYMMTCKLLGRLMREKNDWDNVKQNCANFIAQITMPRLVEEDRLVLLELLKEFMCEAAAPTQLSTIENLDFMLNVRHGAAIKGDFSAEQVQQMSKEIDQKCNAQSTSITIGSPEDDFSPNGNMVKAFENAAKTTGRFHIYISGQFVGVPAVWMENMNSVLDDNKHLFINGKNLPLVENARIIFFLDSAKEQSPATVSRLAWVV